MVGIGAVVFCLLIARFWNAWWGGVPVIYIAFIAVFAFVGGGWAITGPYSTGVWPQRLRATGWVLLTELLALGRCLVRWYCHYSRGAATSFHPKPPNAIAPAYIFYAFCGLALTVAFYCGYETRNKSISEIEEMVVAGGTTRKAHAGK